MAFLFVDNLPQSNARIRTLIKSLEVLLLSAGLVYAMLVVKQTVMPYSCQIMFSWLVGCWNFCRCILSSPIYICIIINLMILLIAASSSFHHLGADKVCDSVGDDDDDLRIVTAAPVSQPLLLLAATPLLPSQDLDVIATSAPTPIKCTKMTGTPDSIQGHDAAQIWQDRSIKQSFPPEVVCSSEGNYVSEVSKSKKVYLLESSSYFSELTKETTTSSIKEGKDKSAEARNEDVQVMRDSSNEDEDTLEGTWKAITGGGKENPKKKQLKKSETWNVPPKKEVHTFDLEEVLPSGAVWKRLKQPASNTFKELKKSETFNDTASIICRGGLRRDPSTSLDEFNRQVEAFIKNFNDNMRLQRQESDQRFLDMINRGL